MTPAQLSQNCFDRSRRLMLYREAGLLGTCALLERFTIRDAKALICALKSAARAKQVLLQNIESEGR